MLGSLQLTSVPPTRLDLERPRSEESTRALLLSLLMARFKQFGSSQRLLNDLLLIKLKTKSFVVVRVADYILTFYLCYYR